ncbi:hypothetical protein [Parachlamydia acanthamoebae]|uniref:hypothetical protein n=1 Tax=Parachlamydia acanthamoebae TaxID=83552 RepID=UPI0007513737|nr:hypothetical protein [Parachlamydia acanthamoebae]
MRLVDNRYPYPLWDPNKDSHKNELQKKNIKVEKTNNVFQNMKNQITKKNEFAPREETNEERRPAGIKHILCLKPRPIEE